MLPKAAQISSRVPSTDRRSAKRRVITIGFDVGETQGKGRLVLLNLSQTGMLFQTSAELAVGEEVGIVIPEAGEVTAMFLRRTGDQYGAIFHSPIPHSAVSAVLLAAPYEEVDFEVNALDVVMKGQQRVNTNLGWFQWGILLLATLVALGFIYSLLFLPIVGWS